MSLQKSKEPKEYLKESYARILIPDEDENGTFSAEILEFPGCFAQGNTPDEAFKNLEQAAISWIEASLDQGHEIPSPSINRSYGGKIALRLPRSIHRRALELAKRDGTTLNQFLLTAIATRIGSEDLYSSIVQKVGTLLVKTSAKVKPPANLGTLKRDKINYSEKPSNSSANPLFILFDPNLNSTTSSNEESILEA